MHTKIINILKPPNPSFSYRKRFLHNLVTQAVNEDKKVLDLGSGGRFFHENVFSIDIDKLENITIMGSASELPFRSQVFDLIISTAVLEHVKHFQNAVVEIERCCANNGLIYIEVPFLQSFHAHPHDYRRFTLLGLENEFSHFNKLESGVCVGPFSVLAWYLRKLPRFICGERAIGLFFEFLAGWLTFWIKYFDAFIPGARQAHQVASGLFFYGVKKTQ